jgi:hypothetical protein
VLALTCKGRAEVDALAEAAAAHGDVADLDPAQDLGFLVNRHLADPDGHIWEAVWMAAGAAPTETAANQNRRLGTRVKLALSMAMVLEPASPPTLAQIGGLARFRHLPPKSFSRHAAAPKLWRYGAIARWRSRRQ